MPDSGPDPAWIWPERPDPRHLAGILPERRDPGQDGRFPVNWPRSSRFLPDSGKDHLNPTKMARFRQLCRNLYLPNIKKNIFILFYIL
jgi:hypothetical protein